MSQPSESSPIPRRWLTRREILDFLGISGMTLIKFIRDPQDPIPHLVLGNQYRFDLPKVEKWAERRSARLRGDVVERRRRAGLASWAKRSAAKRKP